MIERPEERIATEHPDEATGRAEGRPTGGLSTADIAGGRTPMKSDDRPDGTGAQAEHCPMGCRTSVIGDPVAQHEDDDRTDQRNHGVCEHQR